MDQIKESSSLKHFFERIETWRFNTCRKKIEYSIWWHIDTHDNLFVQPLFMVIKKKHVSVWEWDSQKLFAGWFIEYKTKIENIC
jgi:hypothetical protein